MRLLLFTPVDATHRVATGAARLVDTLRSREHSVEIVRGNLDDLPGVATSDALLASISWKDEEAVRQAAARADEQIFIIGNSYHDYVGCADWLTELGGIAYFDDVILDQLFLGWWQADPQAAHAILEAVHGPLITRRFVRKLDADPAHAGRFLATAAPMGGWLAGKARGAACVSIGAVDAIADTCAGPVICLDAILASPPKPSLMSPRKGEGPLRVLTTLTSANTVDVDALITAVGLSTALPGMTDIWCRTVDNVAHDDYDALAHRAGRLGVRFSRALSDSLRHIAVLVDLSGKRVDGPSSLVLDAIARGIPVLVSGTGFSARIPRHLATQIDPEHTYASLMAQLTEATAQAVVTESQAWLTRTTDAEPIADGLLDLVRTASTIRAATRAVDRIGRILIGWRSNAATLQASSILDAMASIGNVFDPAITPPSYNLHR